MLSFKSLAMKLTTYKSKRSFDRTTEPVGGKADKSQLRFVVQKHKASHLHYDFRLEMEGVLKSWAVPKGPSLNPAHKRLAMMVEDHPYDYRSFEGQIPKGEYGGGTVIVWDEGTYMPLGPAKTKRAQQKNLLQQLKEGSVKIKLNGKKLNGEFALVKTKGMAENAWLLIKHKDEYASTEDVLKQDKSVKSGKTISSLEKSTQTAAPAKTNKKANRQTQKNVTPVNVKPMLATLVKSPPVSGNWLYEIKWDGYRAVAHLNGSKVELSSRNNKSFTDKFFPITNALARLDLEATFDGEVVVIDKKGHADFGALQNWRNKTDGELVYYVFDLITLNQHDLTEMPLDKRRKLLEKLLRKDADPIRLSETFDGNGAAFFKSIEKMGLEGMMAKNADSSYEQGTRNGNWLKIKVALRQELVIGGYTLKESGAKLFSALLMGVYSNGKLQYLGKVGTGFTQKSKQELLHQFEELHIEKSPFIGVPDVNKASRFKNATKDLVQWLSPKLVAEIRYASLTADGLMRHASFVGLRDDKSPKDIKLERPVLSSSTKVAGANYGAGWLDLTQTAQAKKVQGHPLKFTNLKKVFWPQQGITKGDVINYYHQMAPFILPYLKNRPQSLNRYPNGINGKSFYQKDVTDKAPSWADTFLYHSSDSQEDKHFLLGNNQATLLYMANLGCIEFHPWNSTVKQPEKPTWCIIDLDPGDNDFNEVILAAQTTKQVCDELQLDCYCKTSGSTGLHIYLPLNHKYSYTESKEFAHGLASLVQKELPKFTTLERSVSARRGKMYIDYLQNRHHATVAAPYSLRPKPGATVSMPLHWDEVKKGLKMADFNIRNSYDRVQEMGDIFKPVLGKGIDLKKAMKNMLKA